MGRSDPIVFEWYLKNLPKIEPKKIAILGSTTESFVKHAYPASKIDLFDIQLGNWDINSSNWKISTDFYDLVICTRCAYFSKNPGTFIDQCREIINKDGEIFVDWGLGDHWRFENFKVGWQKDGEHEYARYDHHKTYVMSSVWNKEWESIEEVVDFKKNIKKFNYIDPIQQILEKEIPSLKMIDDKDAISFLSLWPDRPQLYYITKFYK